VWPNLPTWHFLIRSGLSQKEKLDRVLCSGGRTSPIVMAEQDIVGPSAHLKIFVLNSY
jgi:hypothetical protein